MPDTRHAAFTRRRLPKPTIGWREWIALPALGINAIKAKVDTGARSSALHAHDVRIIKRRGVEHVRFKVHPLQRNARVTIEAEEELLEYRKIRSSTGEQTVRPVILTTVELFGEQHEIELTLVNRDAMGFRMLLGREAVRRRFVIDPGRSFFNGRGPTTKKKKRKKKKRSV